MEERKHTTQNGKYLLLFEKLIFRNGQPVRDDDRRMFVVMT